LGGGKVISLDDRRALVVVFEFLWVARMRVPKMVKNGHNSVLHISASAQEDSCSKKSRTDTKPKTFFESWKANKNHFKPISEQACALKRRRLWAMVAEVSCYYD
jgi:hypothetical protein